MGSPIIVSGLKNSGKTTFINAALRWAEKKGQKGAGFKPFEIGLLQRNATETFSDGELFCQNMQGEPRETLVAPYCAHENYPLEMSFLRDGIRVNWGLIGERLAMLEKLYDFTLIETPDGLFTPITEEKMLYDWAQEQNYHIIWIIHPLQDQFQRNLAEIKLMMDLNLPFTVLFNNRSQILDQDLLFYIWEKIESFSHQEAAGLLPHLPQQENYLHLFAEKIAANSPQLFDLIMDTGQKGS